MSLGKMKGFVEGGAYTPPMMYDKMMSAGMGGAMAESAPIPAGEQEVSVQVSITYELR